MENLKKKYHIMTYGCQMNVHESEKVAGILTQRNYESVDDIQAADLVLFNTCCVRETAENHILGNLGLVKKIKETKPSLIVAVCGCMTQQQGAAEKLKKRCPFIDIIFGTHNMHLFGDYLDEIKNKSVIDVWEKELGIVENSPVKRTSGLNAWVNIMYGCNNFCSYCIVPHVRGRERSRNPQLIIDEVKGLIAEGYKEITLLGQNVNSYGNDLAGDTDNFAVLLEQLGNLDGKFRIKFMTSHPKDLSENVVKAIAASPKIAKFIHLPVQAGNDRILNLMNRRYTAAEYLNKIETIRKYLPDVGLSTDMMVGFPSETESEFEDTLNLLKTVRYNNVYTFIYSRRSGTKADLMTEQVPLSVKKQRIKKLIDTQFDISNELSRSYIGKTFEVLCETVNGNRVSGKTDCNKVVMFDADNVKIGDFINVNIVKSKNSSLIGKIKEG